MSDVDDECLSLRQLALMAELREKHFAARRAEVTANYRRYETPAPYGNLRLIRIADIRAAWRKGRR